MSTLLDDLAGPAEQRHTYLRALPLLRLAAVEPEEVDALFGNVGEAIVLSAAEHLTYPQTRAVDFMGHFADLRTAVIRFEAFHDGTLDEDRWTEDEIAGEVLAPLAWLLHGVEACRACFKVGYHAGMIRGRLNGEVSCELHVIKYCVPCLAVSDYLQPAEIVTGGHGYCAPHADSAPISVWPAHLTSIKGGRVA